MSEATGKIGPEVSGEFLRILAAADGTPRARGVVATALALARAQGAALRIFRAICVPPEFPPAAATGAEGDPLPAYLRAEATKELAALIVGESEAQCGIEVGESSVEWRAILDAATRFDADLIVLGGHHHGLMGRVLGTVASKVLEHAQIDVLVVRRGIDGSP